MTLRSLLTLCSCLALVAPTAAFAQRDEASAAAMEDRPAVKLNPVERGVFFGVQAGGGVAFSPKSGNDKSGLSTGRSIGITVGTDLGERLSLSLMAMGLTLDTPAGFAPTSLKGSGDFGTLVLGAVAQYALLASPDASGVNRFFAHLRVGGGLGLMDPKSSFDTNETLGMVGAGVQYFTRLRHFSFGLDADVIVGVNHVGPGLML